MWDLAAKKELFTLLTPHSGLSTAYKKSSYLISPGNSKDYYLVKDFTIYEFPVNNPQPVELFQLDQAYLLRERKNADLAQSLTTILENTRKVKGQPYMVPALVLSTPEPVAGNPLFITLKVYNKGKDSLFKVKGTLTCAEEPLFNNLVFNLGEVEAGATSCCVKAVELPADQQARKLTINYLLEEANGYQAAPLVKELFIYGLPRPAHRRLPVE